jgi:hypothetical protein
VGVIANGTEIVRDNRLLITDEQKIRDSFAQVVKLVEMDLKTI